MLYVPLDSADLTLTLTFIYVNNLDSKVLTQAILHVYILTKLVPLITTSTCNNVIMNKEVMPFICKEKTDSCLGFLSGISLYEDLTITGDLPKVLQC